MKTIKKNIGDDYDSDTFNISGESDDEGKQEVDGFDKGTLETCANNYYAGYLIKRVIDKFNCSNCRDSLETNVSLTNPAETFTVHKSYGGTERMALVIPNKEVETIIQKSMIMFKKLFSKYKHQELVGTKIINQVLSKHLPWLGPKNDPCRDHKIFLITKLVHTNLFKFCKWSQPATKSHKQKTKNLSNK